MRIGISYTGCEYESEVPVTSEQEAIAFACGVQLGGGKPFVFMQDSGALNCLNNIASLVYPYGFKIDCFIKGVKEPEHHKYSNAIFRMVYETIYSD